MTEPVLRDEVRRALKARTGWSLVTPEHRTVRPLARRCSRRRATPAAGTDPAAGYMLRKGISFK